MAFHLQFRRYALPLRTSVRTAQDVWTERRGLVVRLEDHDGHVGYGEVAPIPAFGTETLDMAEDAIRTLGDWPAEEQLAGVPKHLSCVRSALASAIAGAREGNRGPGPEVVESLSASGAAGAHSANVTVEAAPPASSFRAVAALLPAGRAALPQLQQRAESGFRVFKWKVGVHDIAEELGQLDDLCAALPQGGKLRLDANGGWNRRQAERWLERCAERPIEFVEQPCFTSKSQGESGWRRSEDLLRGLASDFPTPIALDESVVADDDVDRWLSAGWPGWFVLKPSLIGDVRHVIARLAAAHATVVFSSALETAIGARSALMAAFAWTGDAKALGFGVWPLFSDPRFDGPAVAPFIRAADVARIDPESIWTALS